MTKVCLFLVYFVCGYIFVQTRLFNEGNELDEAKYKKQLVPYGEKTKVATIRQRSRTDMHLKCHLGSCSKTSVTWEYKKCELDYRTVSCANIYEENKQLLFINSTWVKSTEPTVQKKCSEYLVLRDVTDEKSGLYRCSVGNNLIKMFQVDIIEPLDKHVEQPPELLTIVPSNITIQENMQFIIQCRVYSKQPPVIWWFKESDGSHFDIQYYDKYYNRINTTVQVYPVPHEVNIYLSKLNVYHAQNNDSGIYVCLAITESGKDFKDAVVQVVTTHKKTWEQHTSVFLLFLIPITFALLPATVWFLYHRKKIKSRPKIQLEQHQEENFLRSILCDNTVSNDNDDIQSS